jgi:hypothetical protein
MSVESVPLGGVGLSGDGPRGAGSPGRSRAGRAPAGGQPGGTSGARRAVEKPWRGGGAGELLGGTGGWVAGGRGAAGGWDGVKSGFIFPIRYTDVCRGPRTLSLNVRNWLMAKLFCRTLSETCMTPDIPLASRRAWITAPATFGRSE